MRLVLVPSAHASLVAPARLGDLSRERPRAQRAPLPGSAFVLADAGGRGSAGSMASPRRSPSGTSWGNAMNDDQAVSAARSAGPEHRPW